MSGFLGEDLGFGLKKVARQLDPKCGCRVHGFEVLPLVI